MKIIRKNVYYCEFCKKKGLSSGHMKHHEQHCTGNIDRRCGMCESKPKYAPLIAKYKAQMESHSVTTSDDDNDYIEWVIDKKPDLDDIAEDCEFCPACILTVLRACGLCGHEWDMNFDLKARNQEWWAEKRDEDCGYDDAI